LLVDSLLIHHLQVVNPLENQHFSSHFHRGYALSALGNSSDSYLHLLIRPVVGTSTELISPESLHLSFQSFIIKEGKSIKQLMETRQETPSRFAFSEEANTLVDQVRSFLLKHPVDSARIHPYVPALLSENTWNGKDRGRELPVGLGNRLTAAGNRHPKTLSTHQHLPSFTRILSIDRPVFSGHTYSIQDDSP
jgi:hypothetical protein